MTWSPDPDPDVVTDFPGWFITEVLGTFDAPGWRTPPEVFAPATVDITGSGVAVLELAADASAAPTGSAAVAVATAAPGLLGGDLPVSRCQPVLAADADISAITGSGTTHVHLASALPLPYALPFVLGGATPIHPNPETNAPATVVITAAFPCAVAAAARAYVSYDTRATRAAVAVDAPAEVPIEGSAVTGHPTLLPFLLPAMLPV